MLFPLNLNLVKLSEILYLWRFLAGMWVGGREWESKLKQKLCFLKSNKSFIVSLDFLQGGRLTICFPSHLMALDKSLHEFLNRDIFGHQVMI